MFKRLILPQQVVLGKGVRATAEIYSQEKHFEDVVQVRIKIIFMLLLKTFRKQKRKIEKEFDKR